MTTFALSNFHILRPQHEISQQDAIDWMASAYAMAGPLSKTKDFSSVELERSSMKERFARYGCKPGDINTRGHEISDFSHEEWEKMDVYDFNSSTHGRGLGLRQNFHLQATDKIFEQYYAVDSVPPKNIIHVSCTGYASPSSAQKVVSKRGWGNTTLVTHAYHMGCYASIPAIRIGSAFVNQEGGIADVVHTELCTLHFNASNREIDQMILQSLFADGYIKYSISTEDAPHLMGINYLKLITTHEMLIPNSSDAMTWLLKDWGFEGYLSKKIPYYISKNISEYLNVLAAKANINKEELLADALFAIHPGGPKILDYIQEILNLQPQQLRYSRQVLQKYGNISSATLPHIWEAILNDDQTQKNQLIVSLAFGPGLNVAGALLIKK